MADGFCCKDTDTVKLSDEECYVRKSARSLVERKMMDSPYTRKPFTAEDLKKLYSAAELAASPGVFEKYSCFLLRRIGNNDRKCKK